MVPFLLFLDMKLIGLPALVFLILSVAATLVLNFSSSIFLFSLVNTVIIAIIVGNYRPSPMDEDDGMSSSSFHYPSSYNREEKYDDNFNQYEMCNNGSDSDDNFDDDRMDKYFSDGYDEDDDDSGSDGEIGWEDDEEIIEDNNLQRRIEDFIAKVNNGWREEWLRDHNLHDKQKELG